MNKVLIGRPLDNPIKDCYSIGCDITRRICVSGYPLEELKYFIGLCNILWDQYFVEENNEIKKIVLKTKQEQVIA